MIFWKTQNWNTIFIRYEHRVGKLNVKYETQFQQGHVLSFRSQTWRLRMGTGIFKVSSHRPSETHLPAPQNVHVDCPVVSPYLPVAQAWHCVCTDAPVVVIYLPAPHNVRLFYATGLFYADIGLFCAEDISLRTTKSLCLSGILTASQCRCCKDAMGLRRVETVMHCVSGQRWSWTVLAIEGCRWWYRYSQQRHGRGTHAPALWWETDTTWFHTISREVLHEHLTQLLVSLVGGHPMTTYENKYPKYRT